LLCNYFDIVNQLLDSISEFTGPFIGWSLIKKSVKDKRPKETLIHFIVVSIAKVYFTLLNVILLDLEIIAACLSDAKCGISP
jgi:uncharacterized Tic20 family protein